MKYATFNFDSYSFDASTKQLKLRYSLDDQVFFEEVFTFNFDFTDNLNNEALDRASRLLFFMAGVSYFKTYLPPAIEIRNNFLTQSEAAFFSKTYQKGLGEFFYVNKLSPNTPIEFPSSSQTLNTLSVESRGLLVGIGGGKDSLVTAELLKGEQHVALWSVGHGEQLAPLLDTIALPHYSVERSWDKSLLELNKQDALNGHVPISAILACVGVVAAVLSGHRDVVVSNESSTSEPNLIYQGVDINHQYSKSLEFEKDFQSILAQNFGDSVRYYSFLRPLSEIRIAELFASTGFEKYRDVFSSCNKAYTHDSHGMFWCGECPKCAFVFLALTPFVEREKLEALFSGKNLLLNPNLENMYRQLLGIEGDKPLECVGEVKESRAAMQLAQKQYPQLAKYEFDLPSSYDFRALSSHSMPPEMYELLISRI